VPHLSPWPVFLALVLGIQPLNFSPVSSLDQLSVETSREVKLAKK
jgi:hypothetical protein